MLKSLVLVLCVALANAQKPFFPSGMLSDTGSLVNIVNDDPRDSSVALSNGQVVISRPKPFVPDGSVSGTESFVNGVNPPIGYDRYYGRSGYSGNGRSGYSGNGRSGYSGNVRSGYSGNGRIDLRSINIPGSYALSNAQRPEPLSSNSKVSDTGSYFNSVYDDPRDSSVALSNGQVVISRSKPFFPDGSVSGTGSIVNGVNPPIGYGRYYGSGYSGNGRSGYSGNGRSGYSGNGRSGYSGNGRSGYSGNGRIDLRSINIPGSYALSNAQRPEPLFSNSIVSDTGSYSNSVYEDPRDRSILGFDGQNPSRRQIDCTLVENNQRLISFPGMANVFTYQDVIGLQTIKEICRLANMGRSFKTSLEMFERLVGTMETAERVRL